MTDKDSPPPPTQVLPPLLLSTGSTGKGEHPGLGIRSQVSGPAVLRDLGLLPDSVT